MKYIFPLFLSYSCISWAIVPNNISPNSLTTLTPAEISQKAQIELFFRDSTNILEKPENNFSQIDLFGESDDA